MKNSLNTTIKSLFDCLCTNASFNIQVTYNIIYYRNTSVLLMYTETKWRLSTLDGEKFSGLEIHDIMKTLSNQIVWSVKPTLQSIVYWKMHTWYLLSRSSLPKHTLSIISRILKQICCIAVAIIERKDFLSLYE